MLFNSEAIFVDVVASSIRKMIVHGAPVPPRHERPAFPVDRSTLDAVAGDYQATSEGRETLAKAFSPALAERTSRLALRAEGARLLFDVNMGEPIPLFLGEDGSLFTKGNGVVVTLARNPSGRVHAVTATQNGVFVVPYARPCLDAFDVRPAHWQMSFAADACQTDTLWTVVVVPEYPPRNRVK